MHVPLDTDQDPAPLPFNPMHTYSQRSQHQRAREGGKGQASERLGCARMGGEPLWLKMCWAEIPRTTVLARERNRKAKGSPGAVAVAGGHPEGHVPKAGEHPKPHLTVSARHEPLCPVGGACRRRRFHGRLPYLPASRLLRWQRRSDLLPGDGRHHHQVHEVVHGAIPVADHVPMGRVQVRFALGEAGRGSPLYTRPERRRGGPDPYRGENNTELAGVTLPQ